MMVKNFAKCSLLIVFSVTRTHCIFNESLSEMSIAYKCLLFAEYIFFLFM